MKQFRLNGKPHQLPTTWAELTDRQVLALAPYFYVAPDDVAARVRVLGILCPALRPKVLRRMDPEDVLTLCSFTEWLWSAPMATCPLSSFSLRGVEYLLPEPVFDSSSAIEYIMAEHYFRQFARPKPAPLALEQLVATLCRPRKPGLDERDPEWDGDRREKYNGRIAEQRAREFEQLPVATKVVVLQYYAAQARAFHERYRELYKKQQGGQGGGGADFGLLGTLDDIAAEGSFGDFERVCHTNVHTIFFHLLKAHREAKARRRGE